MNCPKCKHEIQETSLFCNHCGCKLEKEKQDTVSNKTVVLTCLGVVLFAVIAVLFWMYRPIIGDKRIYEAGVEAHDALQKLRIYTGQGGECDDSCPVCHPYTWRWAVRKRQYFGYE